MLVNLEHLRAVVDEAETKLDNGFRKTSRRTFMRNFSRDHASEVTKHTADLIFIHIHLVEPTRGTSHRIMQAQLLNRRRILSSSTYISLDLNEELQTGSLERSYWTDGGSCLHRHTSRWTFKRNFKQDHGSAVTEQTEDLVSIHIHLVGPKQELQTGSWQGSYWREDLVFIHIHLVGPTRGTSNRIIPAQLLNRRRIWSSSIYISLYLQEELQTGSCQHSYWTDGGTCLHSHTSRLTYKRNFKQDHASTVTEQTEELAFIHKHLVWPTTGTSSMLISVGLTRGTSSMFISALILNRRGILS